jgi:hypothetical protein
MTVLSQGHEGMVDRAARKGFLAMVVVVYSVVAIAI